MAIQGKHLGEIVDYAIHARYPASKGVICGVGGGRDISSHRKALLTALMECVDCSDKELGQIFGRREASAITKMRMDCIHSKNATLRFEFEAFLHIIKQWQPKQK